MPELAEAIRSRKARQARTQGVIRQQAKEHKIQLDALFKRLNTEVERARSDLANRIDNIPEDDNDAVKTGLDNIIELCGEILGAMREEGEQQDLSAISLKLDGLIEMASKPERWVFDIERKRNGRIDRVIANSASTKPA